MKFEDFHLGKALMRAVKDEGFEKPTPVQEQAIPAALQHRDVLGTAQTGTGKTVAFLLPSLKHLLKSPPSDNPRMVALAPTRELAVQIAEEARNLSRFTRLRVVAIYGGASLGRQAGRLRRGVDLVVATPGRLMDHMRRGNVRFKDLEILVLDEADRMMDMGFLPDIEHIVNRMPAERQTMLFSATMPQPIVSLTYRFLTDPVRVEIDTAQPPDAIKQELYPVPKHLKLPLLLKLLNLDSVESALVFTRTKQEANIVTRKLRESGFSVAVIHSDFRQAQRIRALERFRARKVRVLVATNIAARGLDIEGISHVVNFDPPDQAENYIHRIGRTARVHAAGVAWTLVTPEDEPLILAIEYLLDEEIERVYLPGFDYDIPAPDWAKPSAKTILRKAHMNRSATDRWKALTR
ncbi:MAG: DEAD/DEAH box helicase [Anaerolineales bacterium]|nr:DEAD/DEAH box helicase [Anaerolineales bacterium]